MKDMNEIIESLEMDNQEWFISKKDSVLITVPQGQWRHACEIILAKFGIKVLEDVPSKFSVTSTFSQDVLSQ